MLTKVRVGEADFSVADEIAALRDALGGRMGALSMFCGLVRDHDEDEAVEALYLEHYPGMTEASIERILERAGARWPLEAATVVHRVGHLRPADQVVLALTAAGHRQAALQATAFIIDHLKTEAVFWKKERLEGRERWVASRAEDFVRLREWRGPGAAPS